MSRRWWLSPLSSTSERDVKKERKHRIEFQRRAALVFHHRDFVQQQNKTSFTFFYRSFVHSLKDRPTIDHDLEQEDATRRCQLWLFLFWLMRKRTRTTSMTFKYRLTDFFWLKFCRDRGDDRGLICSSSDISPDFQDDIDHMGDHQLQQSYQSTDQTHQCRYDSDDLVSPFNLIRALRWLTALVILLVTDIPLPLVHHQLIDDSTNTWVPLKTNQPRSIRCDHIHRSIRGDQIRIHHIHTSLVEETGETRLP